MPGSPSFEFRTTRSDSAASPVRVIQCPRTLRPDALRLLYDQLPGDQQAVFAQAVEQTGVDDETAWSGLLIAERESQGPPSQGGAKSRPRVDSPPQSAASPTSGGKADGAIWVQRAAGNTAVVWAPPEVSEVSCALLGGAAEFIDVQRIPLAQMVVAERDGYCPVQNACSGFPRFAELQYLFADVASLEPGKASASNRPITERRATAHDELQFVSHAGDEPQRLGALLEQTYIGTLDCPALGGTRAMNDVLEGYRCQGRHSPEDWYFVQRNDEDVGALLLADHPGFGNWELVYMGVVPHARGKKYGETISRFALEVAGKRGAERLVLAVDANNPPALRAYERSGFVAWDRRIVYARLRTSAQHSAHAALPLS